MIKYLSENELDELLRKEFIVLKDEKSIVIKHSEAFTFKVWGEDFKDEVKMTYDELSSRLNK